MSPRRAVAVGGGTGLPLVLQCLLRAGFETTAVVTVADDGGSSGRLRKELGILPPGDIRNCLVAMADPASQLAEVFQYRVGCTEDFRGHAIGNLIIAALTDLKGGFAEAVQEAGRLLGTRGRVLPSTLADVVLWGRDASGHMVIGQANVAAAAGPIGAVSLEGGSVQGDIPGYGPAIDALHEADLIVIGPGSLFTSIIPNFLVDGIAAAVAESDAAVLYVCNVASLPGETSGMDAADHVAALMDHGLAGLIDVTIVDSSLLGEARDGAPDAAPYVRARIEQLGIRVHAAALVDPADPRRHDPDRLFLALSEVW